MVLKKIVQSGWFIIQLAPLLVLQWQHFTTPFSMFNAKIVPTHGVQLRPLLLHKAVIRIPVDSKLRVIRYQSRQPTITKHFTMSLIILYATYYLQNDKLLFLLTPPWVPPARTSCLTASQSASEASTICQSEARRHTLTYKHPSKVNVFPPSFPVKDQPKSTLDIDFSQCTSQNDPGNIFATSINLQENVRPIVQGHSTNHTMGKKNVPQNQPGRQYMH